MRAAILLLALLLVPLVPSTSAFEFCTPTAPGGTHVCVVDWDEPDVICVERQIGAMYRENCVMDPRRFLP